MSFFDELGLKAAEQLEQSVGAYVALASYKRLLSGPPEIRGRATFGALRCAVDLDDAKEVRELASAWSRERDVVLLREAQPSSRAQTPAALALRLLHAGRRDLALDVARAESDRRPSAEASYLLARIKEEASGPDAELWRATIAEAKKESHTTLLARAVARWLELVMWSSHPSRPMREEIVSAATEVDLTGASPAERLIILRARLLAPSRFARASALSGLEELARTGPPDVRVQAILACARDVDVTNGRLEPIEADRTRAALTHWPNEVERESALARLEASLALATLAKKPGADIADVERAASLALAAAPEAQAAIHRARALIGGGSGGGTEAASSGSTANRLAALGLDAVAAMGRAQDGEVELAMARASEALSPMSAVPWVLWNGARMALRSKSDRPRRAAASFIEQALSRSTSAPSFGFVPLASELDRAGFHAVAAVALREALRLKEPGAALALAETQRRLAYAALARGDRAKALELLRESKNLFARA